MFFKKARKVVYAISGYTRHAFECYAAAARLLDMITDEIHLITNREQILAHHGKTPKIDIADAKYDELNNYAFSRSHGTIPLIDYNPRNEILTQTALKKRGYDQNGWPYAPCGFLT